VNKVVEIVDNTLVEAIELRSFIGLEADIAFDRAKESGSPRIGQLIKLGSSLGKDEYR
jgi:hypothetical protein